MDNPKDPFAVLPKRSEITTKNRLIVGAYVPKQLAEHLTLYALYKRVTKSQVVESALLNYQNNITDLKDDMLNILASRASSEWQNYIQMCHGTDIHPCKTDFDMYIKKLWHSLKRKGITLHIAKQIIGKVEWKEQKIN